MFSALFIILGFLSLCLMMYSNPLFAILFIFVIAIIYAHYVEKKNTIKKSLDRIRKELDENSFNVSKEICLTRDPNFTEIASSEIVIDEYNKRLAICIFYKDELKIFSFSELVNCEVLEDGETIYPHSDSPKCTSALKIGMASTPTKSSIRNLSIKLETANPDTHELFIPILNVPTKLIDPAYSKAHATARDAYYELANIITVYGNEHQQDCN